MSHLEIAAFILVMIALGIHFLREKETTTEALNLGRLIKKVEHGAEKVTEALNFGRLVKKAESGGERELDRVKMIENMDNTISPQMCPFR